MTDITDTLEENSASDIVADAKAWLADIGGGQRLQTHSGNCHKWHSTCLVCKLTREIERLRTLATHATPREGSVQDGCTLTDEEREAIEWFAEVRKPLTRLTQSHNREKHKDTLRNLLERNDHDAVPEAIDNAESVAPQPTAGDRSGNPTSHSVTGNTQKPVAWVRFFPNGGPMSVFLDRPPADSEPLYRHPLCQDSLQKNLTEAEHDALEFVVETGRVAIHDEAILRKLLERLK